MELAVTLGKLETVKLLCKVYDCRSDTVFWEVSEVKCRETEKTEELELNPLGLGERILKEGSQRKGEALFNQYSGSH